ncbi:LacI family transcriptional regulator [Pseudomonas chlororaphis]|jgi:DNA-binding LacI/PurR family transcriptional regulator|nr:LacI family transcriptional regulator [Pseudomonas chlororaphis]
MANPDIITAEAVALHAGVSRSAVSRTFTPGASVSARTREKVMKSAEALGYQVNLIARTMNKGSSNFVGVITAGFENPFLASLLAPLTHHLNVHGLMPLLMNANDPQQLERSLQELLSYQVRGVILTSASASVEQVERYLNRQVPLTMINSDAHISGANAVVSDHIEGGRLAARELLRGGAKHLAFIGQSEGNYSSRQRLLGFREELARVGLTPMIEHYQQAGGYAGGQQAALALFADKNRPDGVFCATDMLALGVMDALRGSLALSIPEAVAVVGFDDIPQAAQGAYGLTTVRQDPEALARYAVEVTVLPQRSEQTPQVPFCVPVELVRRRSTPE